MKLYLHEGELLTTHGNLDSTWDALIDLKQPAITKLPGFSQNIPLAAIKGLTDTYGSAARLDSILSMLLESIPELPPETSLICSTTKGAVDQLFYDVFPEKGQVWQIGEQLKLQLGLAAKVSCVSAACASGTLAIIKGAMQILSGECRHALVIGFDILSDFVIGGFSSLKALSETSCKPFDKHRDGLTLGEGAGWLLISSEPVPYRNSGRFCTLAGWGLSCDATHITAPCRKASGLIRTLHQVSAQPIGKSTGKSAGHTTGHTAGHTTGYTTLTPGGINAHGTGTSYNDAMELLAFANVFDPLPPICSVKGSIGHCLGAAGIIEALVSLKSIDAGFLPPTVGLSAPEDKALTSISGTHPIPLTNPSIISCNSGFGGINSAVLFEGKTIP